MAPTNCKCLQKCSLASLGQSGEIKGNVCPSICLFVCLSVYLLLYFFIFLGEIHTINMSMKRVRTDLVWIYLNQGSDFIYIGSSLNHSV